MDFAQLKSEIQLLEKNDVALMRADNDRLVTDVERLKARLREEISRTQAGVRLDLNLEKGEFRFGWGLGCLYCCREDTRREQCTGIEDPRSGYEDRERDFRVEDSN